MPTTYRLDRSARPTVDKPVLDAAQQAVVDHQDGPLLVLAGPGTGKTTTLVEAVVECIESRGISPESVLVLTFSRKAAEQLRDRITARLGQTVSASIASTFHSFAYGLIRTYQPPEMYAQPLTLLSAPEQDVMLRELLTREQESVVWPESLSQAIGTRGFVTEVQQLIGRAREKGLDPIRLAQLAATEGRDEWSAAAEFLQQYLDVLDSSSAVDYPELIFRAALIAERPELRAELRERYTHVFVDEYQDTDPSQVRLLQAIAGDGRNLVVVGDPDQSIYAFRGAEIRGILDFPNTFLQRDGRPAPVVPLRTTRRFGDRLLLASRRVINDMNQRGSIPVGAFETFRDPVADPQRPGGGKVEVIRFDTVRAEDEHIADLLRRAHLDDGIDWSDMAVLVRSGRTMIPSLRRALSGAGVPVEVASDDTPLSREPAVLPLLDALRIVVNLDNADPQHPDFVDVARAESLLLSPLGGMDATELRSVARALRTIEASSAERERRSPRSSPELVRAALLDPRLLDGLRLPAATKVASLAGLLRRARELADEGSSAEEVLWEIWDSTRWQHRLRASIDVGGPPARMAHRDLDAICALFEVAARTEEQRGQTSVVNFLESLSAQQIPAATLADRGVRGSAVRLLTAHRSKGLEWRLVVVAHVQEGSWPDIRRRSTLLQADRVGVDEMLPPVTTQALLAEERRLFYVAATRAGERLVVTSVRSPEDDGEQPSRFVDELGVTPLDVHGRPERPMSLDGVVADLRRCASDPDVTPALRDAAVRRLARLAGEQHDGVPLVPHADPAHWWGTRGRTRSARPWRDGDAPLTVSASTLEALLTCPAKWFLEREAGGTTASTAQQGFGLVVHALADRIAKGQIADLDDLTTYVDQVWDQLIFRTPWSRDKERAEVAAALDRLVRWHERPDARRVLATEHPISADVTLADGQPVRLHGYVDRLEIDADGRVWVVDLKTGKYPPPDKEMPSNAQLGLYQLAVKNGAADDLVDAPPAEPGGAELVQLRTEVRGGAKVQTQAPQEVDGDGYTEVERQLTSVAGVLRSEELVARSGTHCDRCDFQAICPIKGAGTVLS